jgi:hypothetical protein
VERFQFLFDSGIGQSLSFGDKRKSGIKASVFFRDIPEFQERIFAGTQYKSDNTVIHTFWDENSSF